MTIFEITLFWITIAPTYYWLMYALGIFWWMYLLDRMKLFTKKELDGIVLYVFLWIILWWRLGYCLIYEPSYYLSNPLEIIKVWEWWMSFHGWLLWVILAVYLYQKDKFLENISKIALVTPIWIFLWRIWNYLNKELLGFEYSWLLAVEVNWLSYFPSPLLEAFLEWIVLFTLLQTVYAKTKKIKIIWPLFLIWYWVFRIIAEFFRTPDEQIGYILWLFTMWQLLSSLMLVTWLLILRNIRQ